MLIKQPKILSKEKFSPQINTLQAKFGLPKNIKFCSSCVYSNQKPLSAKEYDHKKRTKKNIVGFDKDNVCDACKNIQLKNKIDWKEREYKLKKLCDKFRSRNGSYDCLVPGSGGKDSIFASHILKNKYNMNPLTITFAPHIYTDWGWKNFISWLNCGFDNYLFSPNKRVQRLLTRLALEKIFHPFQPFMMGQMYFPPKFAVYNNIKLIFYGENPTDYGNKLSTEKPYKDVDFFSYNGKKKDIFISGLNYDELKSKFHLSEIDLEPYLPIHQTNIKNKIQLHYLGFYLKWHPQESYYYAVKNSNFESSPERTVGTYSKYSSIDDKMDDLHYFTTFVKFGIGRATYDSAQEVRCGDINREEAIALVKKYDGEYPERFINELFEYLSIKKDDFKKQYKLFEQPNIDHKYFELLTDTFRSPHIWKWQKNQWKLRSTVF